MLNAEQCEKLKQNYRYYIQVAWGSYGIDLNFNSPMLVRPLWSLSTGHLENILITCEPSAEIRATILMILRERYRANNFTETVDYQTEDQML